MAAPASSVWVQVYYEGKEKPKGRPVEITPLPRNVDALAKAVKRELELDAPLDELYVYSPGTKPASEEKKWIDPGKTLEDLIAEYKSKQTPLPTSSAHPLIVVAPIKSEPIRAVAPEVNQLEHLGSIPPVTPLQPMIQYPQRRQSPPRNGVRDALVKLPRPGLVADIMSAAALTRVCIIRSPPGTGKTSLLDLLEDTLVTNVVNVVKRLYMAEETGETRNTWGLLRRLRDELGVNKELPYGYSELDAHKNTWILIDDAQLIFGEDCRGFWQTTVKHLENSPVKCVYLVIAATYDMRSQGSTPIIFSDYPHVEEVMFSTEESEQIFNGYLRLPHYSFARDWTAVRDKVPRLANGHAAVLTAVLAELSAVHSEDTQKQPTEDDALAALSSHRFRKRLGRCFPFQPLDAKQINKIASLMCTGPFMKTYAIDSSDSKDPLAQLVRAGILKSDGTFSCLLAQQYYFDCFYQRPNSVPSDLVALVRLAISSMSANRLRQSSKHRTFPKEGAFQQLLNEALTKHLPPDVAVCPELNTFAEDPQSGEPVTGELDFFIDGGNHRFKWALELLVNGDKIMEHVARFDPTNGKYRKVGYDDYLVVDLRKASQDDRPTNIRRKERRCTVFFHDDYKGADFSVGFQVDAERLSLQY